MNQQEEYKKKAGEAAVQFIENGMVVGLGTGSTVTYFLEALANSGLDVVGVTTSAQTTQLSERLGIGIVDIDEVNHIDVTIDGADEVDTYMNGIKGGGAALLMEKIVANNSQKNIWVVDDSKVHDVLGEFPLPVEIIPYGRGSLLRKFQEKGLFPKLRLNQNGDPLVTDGGHNIIDLHLTKITNPQVLAEYLENEVGVVEHGLFLDVADMIIIGGEQLELKQR
jgi:ribose 5-phosphate isomerase A